MQIFLQITDQSACRQENAKWNRRKSEGLFLFLQMGIWVAIILLVLEFFVWQKLCESCYANKELIVLNIFY